MHTFMVPCLLGLEKLVGDEIRRLGLRDVQVENGFAIDREATLRWLVYF